MARDDYWEKVRNALPFGKWICPNCGGEVKRPDGPSVVIDTLPPLYDGNCVKCGEFWKLEGAR